MQRARPGDLVFSFCDTFIKAIGIVKQPAATAAKPPEFGNAGENWDQEGWRVDVEFNVLDSPIRPVDHMDRLRPLLPPKYSPLQSTGRGNQGVYLASIPDPMANALIELVGSQMVVAQEVSEETSLRDRDDIQATTKLALVQARVGQGLYRIRLEAVEACCRITGVSDRRFLTASHIKPWAASDDREKLDGNNGLLLSPHVDRLFDRGFVTFRDDGAILVSDALPRDVASAWGVKPNVRTGQLNERQAQYMSYHRQVLFKS